MSMTVKSIRIGSMLLLLVAILFACLNFQAAQESRHRTEPACAAWWRAELLYDQGTPNPAVARRLDSLRQLTESRLSFRELEATEVIGELQGLGRAYDSSRDRMATRELFRESRGNRSKYERLADRFHPTESASLMSAARKQATSDRWNGLTYGADRHRRLAERLEWLLAQDALIQQLRKELLDM